MLRLMLLKSKECRVCLRFLTTRSALRVIAIAEVVEEVLVAVLDVLDLCGRVLGCVRVELASRCLLLVDAACFVAHLDDLVDSTLSVCALQVVQIEQVLVHAFQFATQVRAQVLIACNVDWVAPFFRAVSH